MTETEEWVLQNDNLPNCGVMYFSLFLFCDQFNIHSNQRTAQKYQLLPPKQTAGLYHSWPETTAPINPPEKCLLRSNGQEAKVQFAIDLYNWTFSSTRAKKLPPSSHEKECRLREFCTGSNL